MHPPETMQVCKTRAIGVNGDTVPLPELPATVAVPYRVLPDELVSTAWDKSVAVGIDTEELVWLP